MSGEFQGPGLLRRSLADQARLPRQHLATLAAINHEIGSDPAPQCRSYLDPAVLDQHLGAVVDFHQLRAITDGRRQQIGIDIGPEQMVLAMLGGHVELQRLAQVHRPAALVIDEPEVLLDPGRRHHLLLDIPGAGDILYFRHAIAVGNQLENHRGIGNRRLTGKVGGHLPVAQQTDPDLVPGQAGGEHDHADAVARQENVVMLWRLARLHIVHNHLNHRSWVWVALPAARQASATQPCSFIERARKSGHIRPGHSRNSRALISSFRSRRQRATMSITSSESRP